MKATIIGLGSIGSFTTLALAKMGIKSFLLYDGDKVEPHNILNQVYSREDIGFQKSIALIDILRGINPELEIEANSYYLFGMPLEGDIIVCCPDKIEVRKAVYGKFAISNSKLLIDARLNLGTLHVYSLNKDDPFYSLHVREYVRKLQIKNINEPCSKREMIFMPLMAVSLISNIVYRFINHLRIPFHFIYTFQPSILKEIPNRENGDY